MQTEKLIEVLQAAGRFVNHRSPNEAYSKVRIYDQGDNLCVEAVGSYGWFRGTIRGVQSGVNALVDHAKLTQTLNASNCGEVFLAQVENSLKIEFGGSVATLPIFDLPWTQKKANPPKAKVVVDTDDFSRCVTRLKPLHIRNDFRYAVGQRLLVVGDQLHFLCANRHSWGGSWCNVEGGELDAMVSNESIHAVAACRKLFGDSLSLATSDTNLVVYDDDFVITVPFTLGGQPPRTVEAVLKYTDDGDTWVVPRQELFNFLRQAGVFVTPDASGVWLVPDDEGLRASFSQQNDETGAVALSASGSIETLIVGQVQGHEKMLLSQKMLLDAVAVSDDEEFYIKASHNFLALFSEGLVIVVSPRSQKPVAQEKTA